MRRYLLLLIFLGFSGSLWAQDVKEEINSFMDSWHKAAAHADADGFFGKMAKEGVYLGTDKTEEWTRDEMRKWAKPYFARGSAWDFTPISRKITLSPDGKTAWFHEKLDTWMGVCKGVGVLQKQNGNWKIMLYDLSVTIDNDLIPKFLELIGQPPHK